MPPSCRRRLSICLSSTSTRCIFHSPLPPFKTCVLPGIFLPLSGSIRPYLLGRTPRQLLLLLYLFRSYSLLFFSFRFHSGSVIFVSRPIVPSFPLAAPITSLSSKLHRCAFESECLCGCHAHMCPFCDDACYGALLLSYIRCLPQSHFSISWPFLPGQPIPNLS